MYQITPCIFGDFGWGLRPQWSVGEGVDNTKPLHSCLNLRWIQMTDFTGMMTQNSLASFSHSYKANQYWWTLRLLVSLPLYLVERQSSVDSGRASLPVKKYQWCMWTTLPISAVYFACPHISHPCDPRSYFAIPPVYSILIASLNSNIHFGMCIATTLCPPFPVFVWDDTWYVYYFACYWLN